MARRLAAILVADVAGYSRLMGVDEEGTLATLKTHISGLIAPKISEHSGRVVKSTGDGLIAEFSSVVDAVRCATEIQKGMPARNAGVADESQFKLRIAINLGDIIAEGDDIFGDGVNVAARLEALCEPGDIVLSGSAHEQVRAKLSLPYQDMGLQTLKNIVDPTRVYRIRTDAAHTSTVPPLPDKPSIAVLPFTNLSGDAEREYFSDGITEDIITELSRFRSLFVIARNSSFQYRDKAVDVRRVAHELGVRYVLEGSIRAMAGRVRITAQLIDALTGNHIWSERYDRNIDALFDVQDEVTRTIVATLVGRLEDAEISNVARLRTGNLAAYDNLLQGIELLRGYGEGNNRRARELFESAVALDPRFALAHAYLALALLVEHRYDAAPENIKERALEAGLTAIQLDPREGRCHQFLAQAYRYRGEFDLAVSHFERSAALNPNDANGIAQMGSVLAMAGRAGEGAGMIREAMRLNPFHPEWYWSGLAIASYAARDYEDALMANRQLRSRTAYWPLARAAACLAQMGRLEEARSQMLEVLRLKPDFHLSAEKLVYKNPADAEHVIEGMRKAGLPE